jgi:prepilin-type N-terminal cleavage/methylation domain-containing protein
MKISRHFCRSSENTRCAFTFVELLVVITIIGLLTSLLLPVVSRTKIQVRNTVCLSQLRQLGGALRLYASDNNDLLPRAEAIPTISANPRPLPRLCDMLVPYTGPAVGMSMSPLVFKCPADDDGFYETEGSSYWWNRSCNGHRVDTPFPRFGDAEFATVPMLFDFDDFHPRPPQTGRNAVYGDDHADKFAVPLPVVVQGPGGGGGGGGR